MLTSTYFPANMKSDDSTRGSGHILVINPGSTTTKLAVYRFELARKAIECLHQDTIDHTGNEQFRSGRVLDQLELRLQAVGQFLETARIIPDLIMARGGPLRPLPGGIYAVDQTMIDDLRSARYADHASNLAALIGVGLNSNGKIPVYITDPVTTDEFEPLARISGVPGIERKSRSHALNIKASTRRLCQKLGRSIDESRWVVCHMGGGISVAALKNGRIIDVNDALLGMGPFSPERSGALPSSGLLDLAYSGDHDRQELEALLSKHSGLVGYLGTADLRKVEKRIAAGDEHALLIFQAMVYQISKEIAAMASVLEFNLDGILLTGGMARSTLLCESISTRVQAVATIHVEAGENELEALAEAGLQLLLGNEPEKRYSQN
ncbi:MAG: butyrate kinase [Candidatus Marinimicrobia bacterium]|nr:butyrate kinase [Candidatus Neomarinimicrobiota bacterium]